jgi:PBP1b-binding outer membrane lipoprotein LpoB
MKTYIIKIYLLLSLAAVFVAGCNNEDPFTGKDSYITAFSLQQGEAVFTAAIVGDVITVTVPEGFSLTQAKATVKLSENAIIYPDPNDITDWNNEQQFLVTAHNGAKTTYKYMVEYSGIAHYGTVILKTQAEVDAFGAQDITFVNGNLTIGQTAGTDSITSLAPLAGLKEVVYAFTLQPTCAITGLEGLENLERVGGIMQFGGATTATALKHLETVTLPALKSAGGITLQNAATIIVELPELASVSKQFSLNCPLFQLQLPNLQTVGGALTLTTSNASITSLDKVYLPALEEAGSITISAFPNVTKADFPQLKKSGGLSCSSMSKLSIIHAPALEETTGRIYLYGLTVLTEFELPALKQASELQISNCSMLRILEFPKLIDITTINLQSTPVINLAGFSSLQTAGTVTLYSLKELTKIEWPASVQRIDNLTVQYISTPAPSVINVKGINIGTLNLTGNATATEKLIGDEVFSGALLINMNNASPFPDKLPQLEGFSEVDSLNVSPMGANKMHIRGIRKIKRGFYTGTGYSGYPHEFSIPDLEEVGGNVTIWFPYIKNTPATLTAVTFDKLARVGGNFTLDVAIYVDTSDVATSVADTLSFPELTTVGGNFVISSSYDADYTSYVYKGFKIIRFPKLATVGGKLTLQAGTSSSNRNKRLETLDGFKALTSVGSIAITRQAALVDYSGLKELFKTLPPEGWITPTNNGYNPSYQDLKDGIWTKP